MVGRFDLGFRRNRGRALSAVRNAVLMGLLAGCSSVPDAVNPVEWYKGASDMVTGRERADVAVPVPPKGEFPDVNKAAETRKDVAKGLPADRGNAKYAEPVRREVAPTKQLARRAPPAAETQVAAAGAPAAAEKTTAEKTAAPLVPPKPAVAKQELPPIQAVAAPAQAAPAQPAGPVAQVAQAEPRLSPDRRAVSARDQGPDAPPAQVSMTPPAPADIPETVAAPTRGKVKPLQEQFQRRLAESAQQTVTPGVADVPRAAQLARAVNEEEPIHLVPPSSGRKVKGGGKGMAAPQPDPVPAASFQVASVDFRSGSSELTTADRQAIAEVARVYKQTGGVVRVVGHAPAPLLGGADSVDALMGGLEASMKRANAVARELAKRGVPARKILVGADPAAAATGESGAQVFLDVI